MIPTWTLIIFMAAGGNNGVAIDHIDGFTSAKTCEAAKISIPIKMFKGRKPKSLYMRCVRK